MTRLFLFFLLCAFPLAALSDGQKDFQQLYSRFRTVSKFDHSYPREKVYLHLDNNAYVEGETLWLEAYVMRASSLAPTALSRVLYVELLNAAGEMVERKLLRVENGRAAGEFALELPVSAGFYEVRAYTREMLNWGEAAYASRVVPVFAKGRKGSVADTLSAKRPESASDLPPAHPRPYAFRAAADVLLSFFPEGGSRVEGLSQQVAFRLTDGRGLALADSCRLYDGTGRLLGSFRPLHDGMGVFTLPGDAGNAHVAVGSGAQEKRFPLPEPVAAGYAMTVSPSAEETRVLVARSEAEPSALLGLCVTCRDEVCYFDTLTVAAAPVELTLPPSALRGGVNRLVLFDVKGRSRAERLVFKRDTLRSLVPEVLQSAETYAPFAPVALEVHLLDAAGRPVSTALSVAVRDADADIVAAPQASMHAELLLASELRGYVHCPQYYFEADDAVRRRALDILLMVQGWTANPFATMSGAEPFVLSQPIEEKLTLDGSVFQDNGKRQPRAGATLRLDMYSRLGAALTATARTDTAGKFAFVSEADYAGSWIGQFSISENGKKKRSRVLLNRWFDPAPRALDARELAFAPPLASSGLRQLAPEQLFAWEDTIPDRRHIFLEQADVVGKNQYRGFTGNRYSYQGGEKAGMARATLYYNVARETERLKDQGREAPLIWDFLKEKCPPFDYSIETELSDAYTQGFFEAIGDTGRPQTTYYIPYFHGRHVVVFLDNTRLMFFKRNDSGLIFSDEIKSAVLIEDPAVWRRFVVGETFANEGEAMGTYRPAALFLYSNPDFGFLREKKGIEKRLIQGFSAPRRFYSPDYRGMDLPSENDERRTLYWCPDVRTDAAGKAGVVFFNKARPLRRVAVSVRGLTEQGELVSLDR